MAYRLEDTVTINAPPEKVLEALEDVANAPEWVPSLTNVWDIQGQGTGCTYKWRYTLGAISFDGQTTIIESSPRRFVMQTQGGVPSSWTWTMVPVRNKTVLSLLIDYTLPKSKLSDLANSLLIEKQNQRESTLALANLKVRLER